MRPYTRLGLLAPFAQVQPLLSPQDMRERSNMSDDPFSAVLALANARTVVSGGFTAGGAWALRFPAPGRIKFFVAANQEGGEIQSLSGPGFSPIPPAECARPATHANESSRSWWTR